MLFHIFLVTWVKFPEVLLMSKYKIFPGSYLCCHPHRSFFHFSSSCVELMSHLILQYNSRKCNKMRHQNACNYQWNRRRNIYSLHSLINSYSFLFELFFFNSYTYFFLSRYYGPMILTFSLLLLSLSHLLLHSLSWFPTSSNILNPFVLLTPELSGRSNILWYKWNWMFRKISRLNWMKGHLN